MILVNLEILCGDIFLPPCTARFSLKLIVCTLPHVMTAMSVDRSTTAENKMQVAIKYTFDLSSVQCKGTIYCLQLFQAGVYNSATIFLNLNLPTVATLHIIMRF